MAEIQRILLPIFKWWWLIAISTILAMGFSYFSTSRLPPIYRTKMTLVVGRTITDPNPNSGEFYLGQQLAIVYAELGNRAFIRQATLDALNLNVLPEYSVRALPNSQLIEVIVDDTSPERAQVVAMELAAQIIGQSPSDTDETEHDRIRFLQEQLDYLEEKIEETQLLITNLQISLADLVSASEISDTQIYIEALQSKLIELQANYAALLQNTLDEATNIINIIEPANRPTEPISPDVMLYTALSAVAGLALGIGGAYLLEGMDDTLNSPDDFKKALHAPIVGMIPESGVLDGKRNGESVIHVFTDPNSIVSESFHLLRANLQFIWGDKPPRTILITSMKDDDGKTSVALNLAAAMGKTGSKVLLVDADLRNPNIHTRLGFEVAPGFTDSIIENLKPTALAQTLEDDRLKILTRGSPVGDPNSFLSSIKILQFLTTIDGRSTDLMILDGPPLFVADGLVLASRVDAVLIVTRPGRTQAKTANFLIDRLKRSETNLLGIVVNAIPKEHHQFYGLRATSKYKIRTDGSKITGEGSDKNGRDLDLLGKDMVVPPFASLESDE